MFQGLANYANIDIKVRAQFANLSWSDWVTYGTEISPGTWITPEVVRQRYSIPTGLGSLHPNNSQSVAEFDKQYYSPSDLDLFSNLMGVPLANVSLVGPNNPKLPGGESTLDIQWITGNLHPLFYSRILCRLLIVAFDADSCGSECAHCVLECQRGIFAQLDDSSLQ